MLGGRKIVAMCTSRLNEVENTRFITEVSKRLAQQNSNLFLYAINTDLYWDDRNIRADSFVFGLIDYSVTDTVIIMHEKVKSDTVSKQIIREASANGVPVIIVDGTHEGCSSVVYDYEKGFEAVVRHVIEEHGARKPHYMGGFKGNEYSEERLRVFRKVIEENGIAFSQDMVSYGNFWASPSREAAEKLLSRKELPDAVICANDIMAMNVADVIIRHGLRVPEDIIVTGFDGIDEIYYSSPAITSSSCGTSGFTEPVLSILDTVLGGGEPTEQAVIVPELILNTSCGCHKMPAQKHPLPINNFNDRFYRYQDDNIKLAVIAENVQSRNSIEEAAAQLDNDMLRDMSVIISREATEPTSDYFLKMKQRLLGEDMFLFYDSACPRPCQRDFDRSEIIPQLDEVLAEGYPLIFNVMTFMDAPLGYICFHYRSYDIVNYCRIPQIVSTLSWGIGGFVNMQYQHYLTSRIEDMYRFDDLTGLYNRTSFSREFEKKRRELAGKHVPITVILADLDGLKHINDTCGHSAGDDAISVTAKALQSACPPDSLCVRFGGDEMLAIVYGECDLAKIRQDIGQYLDNYNKSRDHGYTVSASVGIFRTDSVNVTDLEMLVRESDGDMYSEKQAKKKKAKIQ